MLTSCSKDDDNNIVVTPAAKEYFTLWNQCEALTALQDYVKDVTDPASANFIPAEDRIATSSGTARSCPTTSTWCTPTPQRRHTVA